MRLRSLGFLIWVALGYAQPVRVYSEFERIDPFGEVVAADRAETPREILSPAMARNAWASFQVAVRVPLDRPHDLFIGQNPANFIRVKLYRVVFAQQGAKWVPDALEPLALYPSGKVADIQPQVPGQTTLVYWMDVWAPPQALVRRARLEVQVRSGDGWNIYPMELRILPARVPLVAGPWTSLGRVSAPSSDSALAVLRGYACGAGSEGAEAPLTIRRMIRRNARQDLALARALERLVGKDEVVRTMLAAIGAQDRAAWCRAPGAAPEDGAEWYLRSRGALYTVASEHELRRAPVQLVRPPR